MLLELSRLRVGTGRAANGGLLALFGVHADRKPRMSYYYSPQTRGDHNGATKDNKYGVVNSTQPTADDPSTACHSNGPTRNI